MKVIFNSDILHAEYLVRDRLPTHLHNFLEACRSNGVQVLVPETTLHEFSRDQSDREAQARSELSAAYDRLTTYKIEFALQPPEDVIQARDLLWLMRQTGAEVEVLEPTLDDYRDAHLRACLHKSPIPPDSQSDEMRDLVIWASALRISKVSNGAILLSRDKVHIHSRGDTEAEAVGLRRFNGVDDALAFLGEQSPVARPIRSLLTQAWEHMVARGFPIPSMPTEISIHESRFVRGTGADDLLEARLSIKQPKGERVEFRLRADSTRSGTQVEISGIQNRQGAEILSPFTFVLDNPAQDDAAAAVQRNLDSLRKLIGETE